jgi:sugar phosphate permease
MFCSAPLLWFGFSVQAGDIARLAVFLGGGWLLYYFYFVTVYPALMDVVPPNARATAVGLLYFFANVFGGTIGTYTTGALSDHFALRAVRAGGAASMTDFFQATGLNDAMRGVIPTAIALSGVALVGAIYSYRRDRNAFAVPVRPAADATAP